MNELPQELFQRIADDSIGAFEEIYRLYYDDVYILARRMLKHPEDAQDAVQQSFLRAYERRMTLRDPAHFSGWLFAIVRNECINILRKRKGELSIDNLCEEEMAKAPKDSVMLPEAYLERTELLQRVSAAIDELPPLQREALIMFAYSHMSIEEIALATDSKKNTVKSRLFYARRRIKATLRAQEQEKNERFNGVILIPLDEVVRRALDPEKRDRRAIDAGWKRLRKELYDFDRGYDERAGTLLSATPARRWGVAAKVTAGILLATVIVTSFSAAFSAKPDGLFGGRNDGEKRPLKEPASVSSTDHREEATLPLPRPQGEPSRDDEVIERSADAPVQEQIAPAAAEPVSEQLEEIAPPTVAPTAEAETSPETRTPQVDPYADAYMAYADEIEAHAADIEAFVRSNPTGTPQFAFVDIYGDAVPEMIYLSRSPGGNSCQLTILTYDGKTAKDLNDTYDISPQNGYYFFVADKTLYSCRPGVKTLAGNSVPEISYYRYIDSSALDYRYNILQDVYDLRRVYDGEYRYYLPDQRDEVTEREYSEAEDGLVGRADSLLFAKTPSLGGKLISARLRGMPASGMTYMDAEAYIVEKTANFHKN